MRTWTLFFLFVAYLVISETLFDNYWGLAAMLAAIFLFLVVVAICFTIVYEKKYGFKPKPQPIFKKVLHQTNHLESIIHELKSKAIDSEIQAVIDRLEKFIADSKRSKSQVQIDGLYEHILVTCYNEIEKTQDLELKKEYTVVIHIIKQLIYGKDSHTICENLIRCGDAYEPEKD